MSPDLPRLPWPAMPAPSDVTHAAQRAGGTARNVAEYLRYGGLRVEQESSPYDVVHRGEVYRLRRYFPEEVPADSGQGALLLVPPLMMMADLYDVAPRSSSVRAVHDLGVDVWLVDFGRPEEEDGGLERSIADHVMAVSEAVQVVARTTGRDVVLGGYSQGGMFAYQAAAYRRNAEVDSIIAFGAPVDFRLAPMPIPVSTDTFATLAEGILKTGLLDQVSLPSWYNRAATRMLDPLGSARFQLQYLRQLHDRERLLPGEQQRMFLEGHGWTAYSGVAFADLLRNFLVTNRMVQGGIVVGDHAVSLADITVPILTIVGESDKEGHPLSVRAIRQAAPRADVFEMQLNTGHFGIVAGSRARRTTWPRVAEWIRWRAGQGELPDVILPADQAPQTTGWSPSAWSQLAQSVLRLGVGTARGAARIVGELGDLVSSTARDQTEGLPFLNRISALRPDSAISLGLLLDESAAHDPEAPALLFEDRVARRGELKHRVDSVVRGLVSLGVRPGDRVGILMDPRPSAFTTAAALSRLGATAVLLRPAGPLAREAELGGVRLVVSDPEHAAATADLPGMPWAVLGGRPGQQDLPDGVVDLERIDAAQIALPAWYQANPTRATDVAFVLFTGAGEDIFPHEITNRRWALSALGAAGALALTPDHTVYSVTPLHHSSALLTAVGAAVSSGARLAFATDAEPATFWEEVRRYGVTHVTYTWSSLRGIVDGPPNPNEHGHPIQAFIGSGMPRSLWKRLADRFPMARVVEFYASTTGEAILANPTGSKVGAAGRRVPGTAEVRVVEWDLDANRPAFGPDGMARECGSDEPGVLVAKVEPQRASGEVLRSLFVKDDAWQVTGDLFSRDSGDDLWRIGSVADLVRTVAGPVSPDVVVRALERIDAVDLSVAYGQEGPDDAELIEAAVTLLPGRRLDGQAIADGLRSLPSDARPTRVRVMDAMPLTEWGRPRVSDVRSAPSSQAIWQLTKDGRTYRRARAARTTSTTPKDRRTTR